MTVWCQMAPGQKFTPIVRKNLKKSGVSIAPAE